MDQLQCPNCASTNVININMTLENGQAASFYSCHACENRWWLDAEGNVLDLPDVLDRARRPRRESSGRPKQ